MLIFGLCCLFEAVWVGSRDGNKAFECMEVEWALLGRVWRRMALRTDIMWGEISAVDVIPLLFQQMGNFRD